MTLRKILSITTVVLFILLITAIWYFPSNDDFGTENPFWNGTSAIRKTYDIQPLSSFTELPVISRDTALIVIPYRDFSSSELEALNRYVSQGGSLVLADDYGHGNEVLEQMNLEVRFTGQVILDPLLNSGNEYFPRVYRLEPGPLTTGVESLVLNHATILSNVAFADILAMSSSFSFLDENDNGTRDSDESTGPFPVVSRHKLQNGEIILISDPSLLINGMDLYAGNGIFLKNVITRTGTVYIDQSHLSLSELHHSKNFLRKARVFLSSPFTMAGIVVLILIITLSLVWQGKDKPEKSVNDIGSATKQ